MSQPATVPLGEDAFGELDLELEQVGAREPRTVYPPARPHRQSDIHELTVPPGQLPSQNLPSSIEEAVLAALDQIPRITSVPPPARDDDSDER